MYRSKNRIILIVNQIRLFPTLIPYDSSNLKVITIRVNTFTFKEKLITSCGFFLFVCPQMSDHRVVHIY
nr:MAG TPA: hypothetical protein [Caudoviricetes sp.]